MGSEMCIRDRVKAAEKIYNGNMDMQLLFRSMETSGKPFVAAINGHALGGGFEICLACHYRVAIDNDNCSLVRKLKKDCQIAFSARSAKVLCNQTGTQQVSLILYPNKAFCKKHYSLEDAYQL